MTDQTVTVAIERQVDPRRIGEATRWVQAGVNLANTYPGFLGSGWVRDGASSTTWHMLYRFENEARLVEWEHSDDRSSWLAQASDFVRESRVQRRTGIEGWFDDPTPTRGVEVVMSSPPRWKQAISIWLIFFPANLVVSALLGLLPFWNDTHLALRLLVSTVILTPMMTYWGLPFITRLLAPWLHRAR